MSRERDVRATGGLALRAQGGAAALARPAGVATLLGLSPASLASWSAAALSLAALMGCRAPNEDAPAKADPFAFGPGPASSPAPAPPHAPSTSGMALVPGGAFKMGSKARRAEPNEAPIRSVTLSPFWMDPTEVTVAAFRACVERRACKPPRLTSRACTYDMGNPELPMNCVSYEEADLFCLAQQKRLPTEAEWEFAARGAADRLWPWGNETPDCDHAVAMNGDYSADTCGSGRGPLPVGGRPAGRSPFGLHDMAGNVEEWVSDFYDDRYPDGPAPAIDPTGAQLGVAHVLRGGGWLSPRSSTRVTARSWGSMIERGSNVGLRCARSERP